MFILHKLDVRQPDNSLFRGQTWVGALCLLVLRKSRKQARMLKRTQIISATFGFCVADLLIKAVSFQAPLSKVSDCALNLSSSTEQEIFPPVASVIPFLILIF